LYSARTGFGVRWQNASQFKNPGLSDEADLHYEMTASRASELTRYQIKNFKKEVLTQLG
jgi:hypothetical protein